VPRPGTRNRVHPGRTSRRSRRPSASSSCEPDQVMLDNVGLQYSGIKSPERFRHGGAHDGEIMISLQAKVPAMPSHRRCVVGCDQTVSADALFFQKRNRRPVAKLRSSPAPIDIGGRFGHESAYALASRSRRSCRTFQGWSIPTCSRVRCGPRSLLMSMAWPTRGHDAAGSG